jgi:hypothetical protein
MLLVLQNCKFKLHFALYSIRLYYNFGVVQCEYGMHSWNKECKGQYKSSKVGKAKNRKVEKTTPKLHFSTFRNSTFHFWVRTAHSKLTLKMKNRVGVFSYLYH